MKSENRKPVSRLTKADLKKHAAWKICKLQDDDDEFDPPIAPTDANVVNPASFDGWIAAEFVAANGLEFVGTVYPAGFEADCDAARRSFAMELTLYVGRTSVSLVLATAMFKGDDPRRLAADDAYKNLGLSATELFPLVCITRTKIRGVPRAWSVLGFPMLATDGRAGVWYA